ncbi:hypothetical protein HDU91_003140, partial [Kappamyces sp. JEL0680]
MRHLTTLDLSSNMFTGQIPQSFASLSSLQNLSLANTSLVGLLPTFFNSFTGLESLDLSNTLVTGEFPNPVGMPLTLSCFPSRFMCYTPGLESGIPILCISNPQNPFRLTRICNATTPGPLFTTDGNGTVLENGVPIPGATMLPDGSVQTSGVQVYPVPSPTPSPSESKSGHAEAYVWIIALCSVVLVAAIAILVQKWRHSSGKASHLSDGSLSLYDKGVSDDHLPTSIDGLTEFSSVQVTGGIATPIGRNLANVPSTKNRPRSLLFAMDFQLLSKVAQTQHGDLYAVKYSRKMALAK